MHRSFAPQSIKSTWFSAKVFWNKELTDYALNVIFWSMSEKIWRQSG